MKNWPVSALTTLLLIIFPCLIKAQVNTDSFTTTTTTLDESKDLADQLVPLDSIITIALIHSPGIKFQQDLVDAADYQVKFMQRIWTNNLIGFVNYSAGNQNLVAADSQTPGTITSSNVTNGYRAGVQLNVPLYEIVGRKTRINIYKSQLQSAVDKKDQASQELTQVIIQQYYTLIYYHNLIAIRSDAKQTTINQYEVAEQEFKDGIIQASELSRLKSIEVNARADYEEAKREFGIIYHQFENMVGVPMNQLMKK